MAPRFQEEAVQSIDRFITDSFSDASAAAGVYYDYTNERARLFVAVAAALFLFNRAVVLITQSLLFRRHRVRRACADALRVSQNDRARSHDD
jgi:hypothetical protein